MRRRGIIAILALALAFGGIAAFSAFNLAKRPTGGLTGGRGATRPMIVAARDLMLGTTIKAEDIQTIQWPEASLPVGYASNPAQVVGRGLITPVHTNEPLLDSKMAEHSSGGGLPIVIPEGQRAVSVRVDDVIGVAGFVLPGTRVDVLLTITPPGDNQQPLTQSILQNVQAIAAGQVVQKDPDGKPLPVSVVTVLVTPEQAEKLVLASTQGRIQLALRNPLDLADAPTNGARIASVLRSTAAARPAAAPRVVRTNPEPRPSGRAPSATVVETYKGGARTLVSF